MKQRSRCGSGLGSHLEGQLGKNLLPSRYPLPQRVFVLTLFFCQEHFSPALWKSNSFSFFTSLVKDHLLKKAFLDHSI